VQNLLSALSDLSNAQNNFMSVWLNYYAGRMQLMRDLGIMQLDEKGRWIDRPLEEVLAELSCQVEPLPPDVPNEWWETLERAEQLEQLSPPPQSQQPASPPASPLGPRLVPPTQPEQEELPPQPPTEAHIWSPSVPIAKEATNAGGNRVSWRDWGLIGEAVMGLQ
jgi:hypothetical protein